MNGFGSAKFAIVGLQNMNGQGKFARHSLGARFVDQIYSNSRLQDWMIIDGVAYAIAKLSGTEVVLVKPQQVKLNFCGVAIAPLLLPFPDLRRIFVAHDEAFLQVGDAELLQPDDEVDISHNGLKSLVKELGGDSFRRIAIGIGSIPKDTSVWDMFFDGELPPEDIKLIRTAFQKVVSKVEDCIQAEINHRTTSRFEIPTDFMVKSQSPNRGKNIGISPIAVTIERREAGRITENIRRLSKLIYRVGAMYSRDCNEDVDTDNSKVVQLLEAGIPLSMRALARKTKLHTQHMSFDIQAGKIVEINAAPLPALAVSRVMEQMQETKTLQSPGLPLTLEMLCERVVLLASRARRKGKPGSILIVDQIGEVPVGKVWANEVAQYLCGLGFQTHIGKLEQFPDADVVWGNLTWMMPERTSSVVNKNGMEKVSEIFPSARNFLFTSKHFLALIHNEEAQEVFEFSRDDIDLVRDFIPRTFPVSRSLATVLLETNSRWYAKPILSSGGRGGGELKNSKSIKDIPRPAVVQEWIEPYHIKGTNFLHDFRICTYGEQGSQHVWLARVWRGSETVQRPMDAPVFFA